MRAIRSPLVAALAIAVALAVPVAGCTCEPPPRTEIPALRARRASGQITIDGLLREDAWSSASRTEAFVDTMDGTAAAPRTTARVTWDDDALYVGFEVEDTFLRCTFEAHDDHLWEQDVVELMIDPDGDGLRYAELQVSPTNLVFDTWFDTRRMPQPFGHIGWSSSLRSAVSLEGTVNDDHDDRGWTAEIAIPWSALAALGAERPSAGAEWRVAMYVLDALPNGQGGVGWSPPLVGDFHVPDRFGRVLFE